MQDLLERHGVAGGVAPEAEAIRLQHVGRLAKADRCRGAQDIAS